MGLIGPQDLSQGTQRTDTAPAELRSASEASQLQAPVYKLHIGPRSYRLRLAEGEQPDSIFATLPETEGRLAYLLWLPATQRPLEYVYLLPATEGSRSRVVLRPAVRRWLPPRGEIRLEKEDTRTGETQNIEIRLKRCIVGTGETLGMGSIKLGLRHVTV